MEKIKTKKCFVILERLDDKLLKLCLQEFGLKLGSSESTNCTKVKSLQSNLKSLKHSNRFKKRHPKISSKASVKHDFRRKKSKSKPLWYTDNESSSDGSDFEKKYTQTNCSTISQSNLVDSTGFIYKTITSAKKKTIYNENFTTETKAALPLYKFAVPKIKETNTSFTKDDSQRTENQQVSSAVENEIEVIKEVAKPENIKCDKIEMASLELAIIDEDNEDDSREDNEDDTNTVIFEEDLNKDTVFERAFEFSKNTFGSKASKDFKSREIINRKKPRLVKFKRKTLVTKNVASIKSKGAENFIRQETPTGVSEEVCCLVKRLHEMFRNISQLQKEWSNNPELAVHFHKMLNAQKENFHREIKRTRNVILKSLNTFGDSRKMALEVGKRIGSNSEDVASVISECFHFEDPCEVDTNKSSVEKMICEVASQSSNNLNKMSSENFTRLLKKNVPLQAVNISSNSQPSNRFYRHSGINLMETQSCENYYHVLNRQKVLVNQNLAAIPYTQNLIRIEHVTQHGRPETPIFRHHIPCKPIGGVQSENVTQYCNVSFVLPCTLPPPSTYPPVFVQKNTNFLPTAHGSVSVVLPAGQSTEMYNKIPIQISNSNKSPNFSAKVLNIPQSGFPPLKMIDRKMPNSQNQTTPAGSPDAFINLSTNPLRVANQKIFPGAEKLPKGPCTELNLKTDSENLVSRLNDPTIPQRLTMRNFRLQAGPVIQSRAGETKPSQLLTEKKNSSLGGESSRVYVCENPGVWNL